MIVLLIAATVLAKAILRRERTPSTPEGREAAVAPAERTERIAGIVEALRSRDAVTRDAAREDLNKLGRGEPLSVTEGVELLRATRLKFPASTTGLWDAPAWIISTVADHPHAEYVPLVEKFFPHWGKEARERGLDLLAGIDDVAAAQAFMRLLREHATEIASPPPLMRLQRQPHHSEVFFPGLLELAKHEALADGVYLTALTFCDKGLLSSEDLAGHSSNILEAYRAERDWLLPKQADRNPGAIWEDDYQAHRERASLLLDLLGCLPAGAVEAELGQALAFRDPRLQHFAVTSLLKHQKPVPGEALEAVAASSEMRTWLYKALESAQKLELFPRRYLTQAKFAESEMVQWLTYPTELGRAPDQIELKKVVSADTRGPDGVLEYYVFRFRTFPPHWAAEKGWTAGVAGPFLKKDAPSPVSYGDTFSGFEPWDAKTPEQHVGDVRELLAEWAERHRTR